MKQITKRLLPGEDLKEGIEQMVAENKVDAGCLLSLVGSLEKVTLRMAGGETARTWDEDFEIVSGTGTVSVGGCHIHISVADKEGKVIGGHLKKGCIIRTTAEIVLLAFHDARYKRVFDKQTGYDELSM